MAQNVIEYMRHLDQERYRAVILHAAPEMGTAVTGFAKKGCAQTGGKYLDLLEYFIQHKELSEHIDSFNPEKLHKLLIEQSQGCALLCIDRADFLLDTWRRTEHQAFTRLISNFWDSYKEGMQAKVMICLQTSHELEALQISDSLGQPRVWRLSDFNDIA